MSNEADKTNVPAGTPAPNGTTGEPTVDYRAAAEAATKRAEQAERLAAEHRRNYDNLHSAYGRQSQQVGRYRDLYGEIETPNAGSNPSPREEAGGNSLPFTFSQEAADLAIVKFRQETPDWNEVSIDPKTNQPGRSLFDEAMAMVNDPSRNSEYIVFRHDPATGKPILDFEGTLRRAYKDAKLTRIESAQAESREAKRALDARRDQMRAAAFVSGEGAAEFAETPDFSKMTSDEIIAKYPELANPDDPPRILRRRA